MIPILYEFYFASPFKILCLLITGLLEVKQARPDVCDLNLICNIATGLTKWNSKVQKEINKTVPAHPRVECASSRRDISKMDAQDQMFPAGI